MKQALLILVCIVLVAAICGNLLFKLQADEATATQEVRTAAPVSTQKLERSLEYLFSQYQAADGRRKLNLGNTALLTASSGSPEQFDQLPEHLREWITRLRSEQKAGAN